MYALSIAARVLCPKDYVRYRLAAEFAIALNVRL
jgi:hypothetical protein